MVRIFKHYIPRSLFVLGFAELIALFVALHLGAHLRFGSQEMAAENLANPLFNTSAAVIAMVLMMILVATGLYQRHLRGGLSHVLLRLFVAHVLALPALTVLFYVVPDLYVGRGAFGLTLAVSFVLLAIIRVLFSVLSHVPMLARRVMVVGTGRTAVPLDRLRRKSDWQGISLIGFLHLKGDRDEVEAGKVIRVEKPIFEVCHDYGVDELVVAIDEQRKNFPVEDIIYCKLHGIQVTDLADFLEQRTGRICLEAVPTARVIFLDGFDNSLPRVLGKRLFDIAVSTVGLLLAWPVMLGIAFMVRAQDGFRHPAIFKQVRTGQGGEDFVLYKFRSMIVDAEKNGAQWATRNDPRITRFGAFIRKTRLDELPQLWNVLKGDMSFVGPRPERPEFVQDLVHKIPFYDMRHRVKPGITGWAQVNYPYGDSEEDTRLKLQYDLYYIKNYSLFLDFTILMQTVQVVLFRKGGR